MESSEAGEKGVERVLSALGSVDFRLHDLTQLRKERVRVLTEGGEGK